MRSPQTLPPCGSQGRSIQASPTLTSKLPREGDPDRHLSPAPCPPCFPASSFTDLGPLKAPERLYLEQRHMDLAGFLAQTYAGRHGTPRRRSGPPPQPHTQREAWPEQSLAPHGGPQHPWTSGTWVGLWERGARHPRASAVTHLGRVPEHLFSQRPPAPQNTDQCAARGIALGRMEPVFPT